MKTKNLGIFVLFACLVAIPTFVQGQGKGIGLGVGNQTHAGANTKIGGQNAGANVGAKTGADVRMPERRKEHQNEEAKGPRTKVRPKTDITSQLDNNTRLAAKIRNNLPSGVSISDAAAGFKNQGQFIAAVNASHNLDIPFDQLKAKMTGEHEMSLGAAIHALRPDMPEDRAKQEANKAEKEAREAKGVEQR